MSSSYHPQTDRQSAVVNTCVKQYLRCFVVEKSHQWHKYLGLAKWNYNTSYHSTIQQTPFEVVYGRPPPSLANYMSGATQNEVVDIIVQPKNDKLQILEKETLQLAQLKMKNQANKKGLIFHFSLEI